MKTSKLLFVSFYPDMTMARYLLSAYVLKAYLEAHLPQPERLQIEVLNLKCQTTAADAVAALRQDPTAPDFIAFSCYSWNMELILELIPSLRAHFPAARILCGGPEITEHRVEPLPADAVADYYLSGEGEIPLTMLLDGLLNGSPATLPGGVFQRDPNSGKCVSGGTGQRVQDLDQIPSVYLTGTLPEKLYSRQQAFIETQRGCRFKCKYCVYHKNLPRIAYFSMERVCREIEFLILEQQVQALRFFDGIFTSDLPRAKTVVAFLKKIKKQGGMLPWIYWEFTPASVDEEFMAMTAELKNGTQINNADRIAPLDRPQFYSEMLQGYVAINCIGIQSFYPPALKAVGRPGTGKEQLGKFMQWAKDYNCVVKADLILGLPEETLQSYLDGLDYFIPLLAETDHVLNIHRLQILPGSDLETIAPRYEINYTTEAPHLVSSTGSMSEKDFITGSELTAVLFRVLNSPLRSALFAALARTGLKPTAFAAKILPDIRAAFPQSKLGKGEPVEDNYWNGRIFAELSSVRLKEFLERIS